VEQNKQRKQVPETKNWREEDLMITHVYLDVIQASSQEILLVLQDWTYQLHI
jgi:hypothetical protein